MLYDFVGFKKVHDEWKKKKEEFVKVLIEQGLKINYGQEHEWKVHVWVKSNPEPRLEQFIVMVAR